MKVSKVINPSWVIIIFSMLMYSGCKRKGSENNNSVKVEVDSISLHGSSEPETIDTIAINKTTPRTTQISDKSKVFILFYRVKSNSDAYLDSILIKGKASNKTQQKIVLDSTFNFLEYEIDFTLTDINFDGKDDIRLTNYAGNYNRSFSYWLYNSLSGKYRREVSLDTLYNLKADVKTKKITSGWRSGLENFNFEEFKWVNGKILLTKDYEENWEGAAGWLQIKTLQNGAYVTKDSTIKDRVVEKLIYDMN